MRIASHRSSPPAAPIRSVVRRLFLGLAFAAACQEGPITSPVEPTPAARVPAAALSADSAARDSASLARAVLDSLAPRVNLTALAARALGPLTNGANHTGQITVAGQVDSWTFTATQGQAVVLSLAETSDIGGFTPWIRLVDSTGAVVGNSWSGSVAQINVNAPRTGTYTVLVATNDPYNDALGGYRLILSKAPGTFTVPSGDQGGALTNGAIQTGTIPLGDVDMWTFTATQGDAIALSLGETADTAGFTPWIRVVDPTGAVIGNNWSGAVAQVNFSAATTGTYTVIVATNDPYNDATGAYRLVLAQAPRTFVTGAGDEGGTLTNGANHTGTIPLGDLDLWTFTANQGETIALSMGETADTAGFTPWLRLVDPSGAVIGNNWGGAVAQVNVSAPKTGTYTVIVGTNDPYNDATGAYRLTLVKAPGTYTVPAGDEGGVLTNGGNYTGTIPLGDLDTWTFTATQGDAVALSVGETADTAGFAPWIRVVDPSGAVVANNWSGNVAQANLTIAKTGTYTVIIGTNDPYNDATGAYRLTLAKAPGTFVVPTGDEGGTLTNGANHTGTIPMGDLDMWRFTANQGEAIVLSLAETADTAGFTPWIRLVDPSGAVIGDNWGGAVAQVNVSAPKTGTYTVIVGTNDPYNDASGAYRLILVKAPGSFTKSAGDQGGALTNGGNHVGTIPLGDLDVWTFTATKGDAVALSVAETADTAGFTPWIRVVDPAGVVVGNSWSGAVAQVNLNAELTGTYTVIIGTNDPYNDATGAYRLTLAQAPRTFIVPSGDQGGAMTNGANHTGTIPLGDLDLWTFTANQGEAIVLSLAETADTAGFTPWIRLVDPSGAVIGNSWGGAVAQLSLAAPKTGSYTVIVGTNDPYNDATGAYRLTLAKSPGTFAVPTGDDGGTITIGSTHDGAIPLGDLDLWSLTASPRDTVAFTVTRRTGDTDFTPWLRVFGPTGALLVNSWYGSSTTVRFVVPTAGTYTIVVGTNDPYNDATGTYQLGVSRVP